MGNEQRRELLPVPEVATILSLGQTKVRELIKNGSIRSVRIGTRRLVHRSAIDDFVDALRLETEGMQQ